MAKRAKVRTRIGELARGAGITNAHQLQVKAGLSSPTAAARLYRDEVDGLKLRTIEQLCGALGCEPGDIFVRQGPRAAGTRG